MGVGVLVMFLFFFFKQKTAYEMRISDWSSDVCSSDLVAPALIDGMIGRPGARACTAFFTAAMTSARSGEASLALASGSVFTLTAGSAMTFSSSARTVSTGTPGKMRQLMFAVARSEEHTSELQSLMRISYAVFCL